MAPTEASAQAGPFLDFELDPDLWLIGPTPARPAEQWVEEATDLFCTEFDVAAEDLERRGYVGAVLEVLSDPSASALPYFALHWPALEDLPVVLYVGQVDRLETPDLATVEGLEVSADDAGADPSDITELWLMGADLVPVEKPVHEVVPTTGAIRLVRSLVYAHSPQTSGVTVTVRYVVDTGDPDCIVLAQALALQPADILRHLDDFENLLRTVTLRENAP